VNSEFAGNALFQKALKDAFVEVVNRDAGKYKSADLLSSFCDRILKTGSTEKLSDAETEEFLEKTVQMFSYLTDKDLFAEIYRNQLAKRLLNQRSASDEMERLMIGKLKLRFVKVYLFCLFILFDFQFYLYKTPSFLFKFGLY
jgi:cullin 1